MTNAEAWFNVALRPQRRKAHLGRGKGGPARTATSTDFHTAPELWCSSVLFLPSGVASMSSDHVGWHINKLRPMCEHGSILLYVHGNREGSLGRTAQDGHIDSHTGPAELSMPDSRCCWWSFLYSPTVRLRPCRSISVDRPRCSL